MTLTLTTSRLRGEEDDDNLISEPSAEEDLDAGVDESDDSLLPEDDTEEKEELETENEEGS
ncbi:MAG: hypothetical protein HYS57_02020 [Parcubacteria group bacterium]|nr:hypothetical protein [Parcubacteria group bacterium]